MSSNCTDDHCNIYISILAFLVPIVYCIRCYCEGGQFRKRVPTNGLTIIITGANTGIGREVALHFAKKGAKVCLACRDMTKGETARKYIFRKTSNFNVYCLELDLASIESIHNFVKEFKMKSNKLHVLINNAGVYGLPERILTKDGFEMMFGVNHLGHFLLTNLLLDLLKKTKSSRIVNVSSVSHYFGKMDKNNLNSEIKYDCWTAYCQSKLANVLFTRELSKQLAYTKVTVNSLHPGVIVTDLRRSLSPLRKFLYILAQIFMKSVKSGAQTTIAVALDPTLQNVTGKYFSDCRIANESKVAKDDEMAKWLWQKSEQLVGLNNLN